jgi:hypothetical protein
VALLLLKNINKAKCIAQLASLSDLNVAFMECFSIKVHIYEIRNFNEERKYDEQNELKKNIYFF